MSAGMPELGSKISLISKADIRYEGRLFTVDPQECTIALANVRSFGTEDREAECLVAPQNQVYDYILFRGSDIKDIRVVNNIGPIPNDPAIVQLSVPQNIGSQPYQPSGFNHPVMGHMGHGMPQYPQYGQMGPIGGMPSGMAPGMGMYRDPRMMQKQPSELVNPVHPQEHAANKDQEFIGGSRTVTPTLIAPTRKSPTVDQGVQVSHMSPPKDEQKAQQLQRQTSQGSVSRPQPPPQQQQREQFKRDVGPQQIREHIPREQHPREQREQHQREQRESRDQHPREHREQNQHPREQQPTAATTVAGRGTAWVNRGGAGGGVRRGRGRGSGVPPGGAGGNPGFGRPLPPTGPPGGKPKNTLKFDNDYDFEQANTEFEELRTQLAKVKVDGAEGEGAAGAVPPAEAEPKVNGEVTEKKDDSGNETATPDDNLDDLEHDAAFYDKTKSFFDNISCEAVERSKGRSQRTDWRTERKLNSETFGVASARRGGFRGRGGYYNRGGGGGIFRGGNAGGGTIYRGNFNRHRGGVQRAGAHSIPPLIRPQQVAEVK